MKNTTRKTLWSVDYSGIGYDSVCTRWFDNREDADKFAREDYRDTPVRHTMNVEKANAIMERQQNEDAYYNFTH